jgi:hypothetical protein
LSVSWTRDGTVSLKYLEKGSFRLLGRDAHIVDVGQPILGLEADLEKLTSNISTVYQAVGWGAYTTDAALPHMPFLGMEDRLEMALLAPISHKRVQHADC